MITLVIFDLDGLLVDSQPLQYKAYNQVFSQYGYPLSKQEWCHWIQNSYKVQDWIEKNTLPLDAEEIRSEKQVIFQNLIKNELQLKPGAKELVEQLSQSYMLCVASASRPESIKMYLDKFHLSAKFIIIASDYDVTNPKPYPDVYLRIADELHVDPAECLVIEDSMAGLRSAKAAGMKCIICPDSFCAIPTHTFKGADLVVRSLNELVEQQSFIQSL